MFVKFNNWKFGNLLKKISLGVIFILICIFISNFQFPGSSQKTDSVNGISTPNYTLATVIEAGKVIQPNQSSSEDSGQIFNPNNSGNVMQASQNAKVKILFGSDKNKELDLVVPLLGTKPEKIKVNNNDWVILLKGQNTDDSQYYFADKFRLIAVALIAVIFFGLVICFARFKGVLSLAGLSFSVLIIFKLLIPGIISGLDPYWLSIAVVGLAAVVSIYLAHGFHKRTSIAVASILITLVLAAILASTFAGLAKLSGMGTEESVYLQFGVLKKIDFQGLFLAGVMIGVLGVLDDIATAQVTIVHELKNANFNFGARELYTRAIRVGKEHIASLVNTLAFAYIGTSFALIISLYLNQGNQPWWFVLNNEMIVEEIVNTLVGSSALVLGVPISTLISSWYYGRLKNINDVKGLKFDTRGVHVDPNQIQNEISYRTKGELEINKWLKR